MSQQDSNYLDPYMNIPHHVCDGRPFEFLMQRDLGVVNIKSTFNAVKNVSEAVLELWMAYSVGLIYCDLSKVSIVLIIPSFVENWKDIGEWLHFDVRSDCHRRRQQYFTLEEESQ
ncbi:hypothetical protein J6590_097529 [Homalodisca vitripennis]|nr:hypothetical protein J6590_097529 [Homalodisca vitripennis]